jgi:hypothetical protein
MKRIIKQIKELIEATEPNMTVIEMRGLDEPFACPIGTTLWEEYRRRKPDGIVVPPEDLMACVDQEMAAYVAQV